MRDYENQSVEELRQLCRERGFGVNVDRKNKQQVIATLQKHDAKKSTDATISRSRSRQRRTKDEKPADEAEMRSRSKSSASRDSSSSRSSSRAKTPPAAKRTKEEREAQKQEVLRMSSAERLKRRVEKFGTDDVESIKEKEQAKKSIRAARFGLVDEGLEQTKRSQRAARFATVETKETEAEQAKRKLRMERFGVTTSGRGEDTPGTRAESPSGPLGSSTIASSLNTEERLRKRALKFGTATLSDAQRKSARSERFGVA